MSSMTVSVGSAAGDAPAPILGGDLWAAVVEVLDVLEHQQELYGELQQLVSERQDALVAADAPRVSALVDRGQGLIDRVQESEAARLEAVRPVAQRLGLEPEQVTVSRLCAEVDRATAAALRAAQGGLLTRIERLAGESRREAHLLEGCMASATRSLQHLLQSAQPSPRYASDGHPLTTSYFPRITDRRA